MTISLFLNFHKFFINLFVYYIHIYSLKFIYFLEEKKGNIYEKCVVLIKDISYKFKQH